MTQALASSGVSVPDGFATTAGAYRDFLRENDLIQPIGALIERCHRGGITLSEAGGSIRSLIPEGCLSEPLTADLCAAGGALRKSTEAGPTHRLREFA